MCGLRVRFSQSPETRSVYNYALRVEVVGSKGISRKIFVYHQTPVGPTGDAFSEFDHVATPVDFQEIPEDAASETVPYYRTSECVIWVRNVSDLVLAKQMMVDDIAGLQRTYDVLTRVDDFRDQTTMDFGDMGK